MDNKHCSTMSSSPEDEQNSVPSPWQGTSVLSEQDEILMEETLEQPRDSSRTSSPSIRAITEEVEDILLLGAKELCGTERMYLRHDSLQTASDIVQSIIDKKSQIDCDSDSESPIIVEHHHKTSIRRWTGVYDKIKAFLTLSYAKAILRSLLRRLGCYVDACLAVPLEEVIEEASPVLQELVHEGMDHVDRKQLREKLTDIMSPRVASDSGEGGQIMMWKFTDVASKLLHLQTKVPETEDQVQRALERVYNLVYRMSSAGQDSPSAQLKFIEPVTLTPQPISHEHMRPSEIPAEGPTADVPQAWLWTKRDCGGLVYEVVSRIQRTQKNSDMMPLSRNLMAQLCKKMPQWHVVVKPSVRSCKKVSAAVYKELCRGQKNDVMHAADFSSEVLDSIQRNLTAPPKKRRTLGSFLRSVCSAICRR